MAASIPKRERLMNLVSVLLAAKRPVPFREIIGKVIGYDDPGSEEALEKRLDRDKTDLRQLGIPIDYVSGEDGGSAGYVVRAEDVFQQKVSFTPQEVLLLAIAARAGAAATGGGALEDSLRSALRKLAVDVESPEALPDIGDLAFLRAQSGDARALHNVTRLAKAVTQNSRVRFVYQGLLSESPREREVDPYGLGLHRGDWFLAGYCHLREAIRVFKVSRILESVEVMAGPESHFRVPESFRLDEHLGREAWDFAGESSGLVRLWARAGVSLPGGLEHATRRSSEGGGEIWEVEVRRPIGLLGYVLASAGDVTVLEPTWLRDEVSKTALRMLHRAGVAVPPQRGARPVETSIFEGEAG